MRALNWIETPLGPVDDWPESLKTCIRIILTSRQPMFIWWGDERINLYNDAYRSVLGAKHPGALARPAAEVWKEIWDQVGPRASSAMDRNEGTYDEALELVMERNGYPEETYFTFSYSPVPNDRGGTGGIFCANSEDTARIIGARQVSLLRELAARTSQTLSVEQACERAALALSANPRDVTFALIYLTDERRKLFRRLALTGVSADHPFAPPTLSSEADAPWPLGALLNAESKRTIVLSPEQSAALPAGPRGYLTRQVALVPLLSSGGAGRAGALVIGLNPLRLFDDDYRGFVNLMGGQIAGSIARADAYQQERKRAESLAELDRAKTAFFSNISHEFRTPLTLMLGPIQDALDAPARELSGESLAIAHRNALRLLKLVNALLDFSRLEAGRAEACFEPLDLSSFTADLASAFRAAIERAGLRYEVETEPLAEPVYVDPDMWEKIVFNLLSNALKFTFDGRIRVSLRAADGGAALSVYDTGTGIPESELGRVFERFHRIYGARSRTHEGSGIGLAMVHELVRLHGGSIQVSSQVGVGSEFTVWIPFGRGHLAPERVRALRTLSSTRIGAAPYLAEAERWSLAPLAGLDQTLGRAEALPSARAELAPNMPQSTRAEPQGRIIVADDNADMRAYVVRLLSDDFEVQAVADGREALRCALENPPDLVVTDVMMPFLDGFGLLRALRAEERTARVPVLMLSARAGEESRVSGLEAGADDYLVKPFSARELVARVAAQVQISRLRGVEERERRRLYAVFMQAPVPVAVLTGDELRFEVANQAYCELTGHGTLIGKTLAEAFPEPAEHLAISGLLRVHETGETLRVSEAKSRLRNTLGEPEVYVDFIAQPLFDSAGAITGIITVLHDVTQQVVARRKIERLRDIAERANRTKDEFLSTLSHELRTPLSAIIGWATLLREGAVPEGRMQKAVETIERNAKVQARLVEDMLDLSRIEQGKLLLSVGPLELVRVVTSAIDAVRPAAEAKGVRLQPVLDSHAVIVGDADRLQQVFWNLFSNAIKFTPKGGRVHVRLSRHMSYVELVVADTGQGIEPEFLPHVFDRFRQADPSYARRAGGLGLGLAIVRSLVELHGGTVSVSSEGRDKGAAFTVQLPIAPLRGPSLPALLEDGAEVSGKRFDAPPELQGLRVLVLDDEAETRELLKFVIEQCEGRVVAAETGNEVLELLRERPFDVLISDVGMPGMDGYELIAKVRALAEHENSDIPALALTAYARPEDRTQALRAGFHMHLAKPIDPSELLVVIATLVKGYLRRRRA